MSTFHEIKNAKAFTNSRKLNPGFGYDVEIVRMSSRKSGRNNTTIVPVEFKILRTNDPDFKPGDRASWVPKQSQGHAFLSNLLAFVLALHGMENNDENQEEMQQADADDPEKSVAEALLDNAVSEDNTFEGMTVRVDTWATKTGAGFDFVGHSFSPLS